MSRPMHGTIRHRLLVNYAADPEVATPLLPAGLRPQLVRGRAVLGICVLRLTHLRPAGVPPWLGASSDAAAHRVAVEWDGPDGPEVGVFVLRRDTAQRLPALIGGRLFPGVHRRAAFRVDEQREGLHLAYRTGDALEVDVTVGPPGGWSSRLFADAAGASAFFQAGACGFSSDRRGCLEGIEMLTDQWSAEPVSVTARSSFYEDPIRFPPGSIHLDAALIMRDLPVTWREVPVPARDDATLTATRVSRAGAGCRPSRRLGRWG